MTTTCPSDQDAPQGHREPPTRAELRAWKRWLSLDGAHIIRLLTTSPANLQPEDHDPAGRLNDMVQDTATCHEAQDANAQSQADRYEYETERQERITGRARTARRSKPITQDRTHSPRATTTPGDSRQRQDRISSASTASQHADSTAAAFQPLMTDIALTVAVSCLTGCLLYAAGTWLGMSYGVDAYRSMLASDPPINTMP